MASVQIDLKTIERLQRVLATSTAPMEKAAQGALDLLDKQISAKLNKDGSSFAPYTPAYAARKGVSISQVDLVSNAKSRGASGKLGKGVQGPKFNLAKAQVGGHMLKELGVTSVSKTQAIIGFLSAKNRAKAAGLQGKRPFMGLMEHHKTKVSDLFRKELVRQAGL